MKNKKSVVVIGGGVAGLSAGIYAEQHGLHAIVLEKNPSVGGMCTGWYRKNFYLDGCLHWLTGTKENTLLHEMWQNVNAINKPEDILYLPSWGTFEYQGQSVTLWRDLDRAEKEWTEVSPIDKKLIHKFFKMVRDFAKIELPLDLPLKMIPLHRLLKLGLQILPVWPSYIMTMFQNTAQFAAKFKSPVLRFALTKAQPGYGNLFSMIYSYSSIVIGDGGLPKGGSKPMVERMKDKLLSLGGTLRLNANVETIIIKNNTASGVKLEDGQVIDGDYVVSCLDTNFTLKKLLLDQYPLPSFSKRFNNPKRNPSPSCCIIHYAIKKENNLPIPYSFECQPFHVGEQDINHLTLRSYSYDETFTRGDKTVLFVMLDQSNLDYPYWKELSKDRQAYLNKKKEIAAQVKERILKHLPDLGDIEFLDFSTPYTFNRYVNSSNGVYMSFSFTKRDPMFSHSGHLKGLNNFYLSGQWLQGPGGVPIALTQGKFAIQRICKKEKMSFIFSSIFKNKKV